MSWFLGNWSNAALSRQRKERVEADTRVGPQEVA